MTEPRDTSQATGRVAAYLDARDAGLAHVPRIGPGVITGWPRTENDVDGEFELTADDLRAVLAEHQQMRATLDAMQTEWASKNWDNGEPYYVSFDTEKGARMSERRIPGAIAVHRLVGEWQQADKEQDAS